MHNTRAGDSKWREIIPLNDHDGDQLYVLRFLTFVS